MKIQAIIFDLGGVLLRTEDRTPRTLLAQRYGMSCEQLERMVFESNTSRQAALGLIRARQHWQAIARQLDISEEEIDRIQNEFFAGDRLDVELLNYLKMQHSRRCTALLSNGWSDLRPWLESDSNTAGVFDEMIISAEVGLAKPDARIYHLTMERLGTTPEHAVFVDDFIENVEGARRIGLQAIHFINSRQILEDLNLLLEEG